MLYSQRMEKCLDFYNIYTSTIHFLYAISLPGDMYVYADWELTHSILETDSSVWMP